MSTIYGSASRLTLLIFALTWGVLALLEIQAPVFFETISLMVFTYYFVSVGVSGTSK